MVLHGHRSDGCPLNGQMGSYLGNRPLFSNVDVFGIDRQDLITMCIEKRHIKWSFTPFVWKTLNSLSKHLKAQLAQHRKNEMNLRAFYYIHMIYIFQYNNMAQFKRDLYWVNLILLLFLSIYVTWARSMGRDCPATVTCTYIPILDRFPRQII